MVASVSKRALSQNEASVLSQLAAEYEVGAVSIHKNGFLAQVHKTGSDGQQKCVVAFCRIEEEIFVIPQALLERIDFENGTVDLAA
ncbi:MAG: hypothetical protein AABY64_12670 [Bdellovibrionota bacterium]